MDDTKQADMDRFLDLADKVLTLDRLCEIAQRHGATDAAATLSAAIVRTANDAAEIIARHALGDR